MKKVIHKLNQLNNLESFLQINFSKGFKYVDRAGEIVNLLHDGDVPPNFSMDLQGLIIKQEFNPKEIKLNPGVYWEHYYKADSLGKSAELFEKNFSRISPILDLISYRRIGWRNYFIYEVDDSKKREKILNKFTPNPKLKPEEVVFSYIEDKVLANISIKKIVKNNDASKHALLLDTDTFITYQSSKGIDSLNGDVKKIREFLQSDNFLECINSILSDK